jgi:hypothetical protein
MKNDIYLNCKAILRAESIELKQKAPKDKTYIRYSLNTLLDELINVLNRHELKEIISQKQNDLYKNWLTNYTIQLHPKD